MSHPKLFISYHPFGPGLDEFVVRIAGELRERGVDVSLDKWDLAGGVQPREFTRKMVSDPGVKIAIISDKQYVETADQDSGGETPVINRTLYQDQPSDRFALVISERNETGVPYVPSYYRTGIFIDMSEPEKESQGFEELLRWACGRPIYPKPPLGPEPESYDHGITLGTRSACNSVIDAIKHHRANTGGRIDEYLNIFGENIERFRITEFDSGADQAVFDSVNALKPFRDEFIRFLFALAGYRPNVDFTSRIHKFFEHLISYTRPPDHRSRHSSSDLDNFLFIVHELFLYTIAIFLRYEMFRDVDHLLTEKYYVAGRAELGQEEFITFDTFHQHIDSLDRLNQDAGLGHEAIRAEMIKARAVGTGVDFRHLMQADFTIFLRAEIDSQPYYSQWWPETLMFLGDFRVAFEIFAKARSREYFEQVKVVIGIDRPGDLVKLLTSYEKEMRQIPRGLTPHRPSRLVGFKLLATQA